MIGIATNKSCEIKRVINSTFVYKKSVSSKRVATRNYCQFTYDDIFYFFIIVTLDTWFIIHFIIDTILIRILFSRITIIIISRNRVVDEHFDGCSYLVEQADAKAMAEAARKVETVGGSVKLVLKKLPEDA